MISWERFLPLITNLLLHLLKFPLHVLNNVFLVLISLFKCVQLNLSFLLINSCHFQFSFLRFLILVHFIQLLQRTRMGFLEYVEIHHLFCRFVSVDRGPLVLHQVFTFLWNYVQAYRFSFYLVNAVLLLGKNANLGFERLHLLPLAGDDCVHFAQLFVDFWVFPAHLFLHG